MFRLSPRVWIVVFALGLCSSAGFTRAQTTETATLTITVDGPVSGAVGVIGPGGNVCNPNPGGGPTHGTCIFTYQVGAELRITANSPNPDAGFLHSFSGDTSVFCVPETSTCDVVLTNDSSLTATFDASRGDGVASLDINLAGDGKGNVGADNNQCQNFELDWTACTTYYAKGSEVRLQGRSMPGNIFEAFSGGTSTASVCGADAECRFTLTENTSVDATFSALESVAIEPLTATISVGMNAFFSARATFTNDMTRPSFNGHSPWRDHVPMDLARFSLAAVVVNDRLYAIGGVDGPCLPESTCPFAPRNTVEVFNPLVNLVAQFDQAWTPRAGMNTAREGLAAAVVDGKIYALGGHTGGGNPVESMEAFDPATDAAWANLPSMSGPRAYMAAAVIGNTIYVVGGDDALAGEPPNPLNTVEAYDTVTGTWTTKNPTSIARRLPAAAVVNGILYVIGGDGSGSVEAYDPLSGEWTPRAAMPDGGTNRAVALDGLIYVVGGPTGSVKVYNPAVDSWLTLGSMPSPLRDEFALAVLDGRLFAAGGLVGDAAVATLSANRPPEATWWSSNSGVGRIDDFNNGRVSGVATGTAIISARLVGMDSAPSATLTVNTGGGGGGGGGSTIFLGAPSESFTQVGSTGNWGCVTFGQNADGPWEATVNYGDGSGDMVTPTSPPPAPCGGGTGTKGWFWLNHEYDTPATYQVIVTVRNTTTNESASRQFPVHVQEGGGGGGGGSDECVPLITNFAVIGTVPFETVQGQVFDRETGVLLGGGPLPLGLFDGITLPEGQFRFEFSVPEGYVVEPSIFSVDGVCGQTINLNATVSPTPVTAVSQLISTVEAFNLQQGIANSLDAKLQRVLDALNGAATGNTAAVCNQLVAFINETTAQSGNRLTVDQANQLIAAAQQIRAIIGCQ